MQPLNHLRRRFISSFGVDVGVNTPLAASLEHHITRPFTEVKTGVAVYLGRHAFTLKLIF